MLKMRWAIILAVAAFAGCGGDGAENNSNGTNNVRTDDNNRTPNNGTDNNGSSNNGSTNNGAPNNGSGNNGSTNNGTGNNTTGANNTTGQNNTSGNNGGSAITETEPNDTDGEADMVSFGSTVSGSLESGGNDVFSLTSQAGKILEVEVLVGSPTLNVSLFAEGANSDVPDRRFDLDFVAGNKRQFFLPEDDIWYVRLQSLESVDWDYEFVVREVTPAPITDTFGSAVTGDLNDGAVDVYELPDADGQIAARLDAERLASGSDLDSVMYVYGPAAGFVTFNDDASASTDSELDFTATAGETYWLVVDAWLLGADNPYELTVTLP